MKIIFVNRYFHPDQSATSRMLTSLAFALAARGLDISVVTSRAYHDSSQPLAPAESAHGVSIHRLGGTAFGRRTLAGRAADYMSFHVAAMAWLSLHVRKGDLCVVCTDPPLVSVSTALPLALRGARTVNWIMDLFPETAIELGMLGRAGGRITTILRDWSARRAALNVCPIGGMARYLEARGIARDRLTTLHHWSDGDDIVPVARSENRLRSEWDLGRSFVVGYSGNFGRAHDFGTLLDAAEMLQNEGDIRFLLIGDGQKRRDVEREIARRGLRNIVLKPFQPKSRLKESLGAADVHIVSLLPQLEHCIVPSKFYGVLAAGRPTLFVGSATGEIAGAVGSAHCGVSVEIGDAAGLIRHILLLRDDPELHRRSCENARALFDRDHTRERGVGAWHDLVLAIARNPVHAPLRASTRRATP